MSAQQEMFRDYESTGVSLRAHPFSFLRQKLKTQGVSTAAFLQSWKRSSQVQVAGLALFRQRPGTAKGVVFITLEDETGMANLIVRAPVFDRYQKIVLGSSALLAQGRLENIGKVVYVLVERLSSLDEELRTLPREQRSSSVAFQSKEASDHA
jgi:error-prone DNA polymerase